MIPKRIAVLGGNNYGSPEAVRSRVQRIPPGSILVITTTSGVSLIAMDEAVHRDIPHEIVKWYCKPHLVLKSSDCALVFYDTSQAIQDFLSYASGHNFPFQLFDERGNSVDFRRYLASNPNHQGDRKVSTVLDIPPSKDSKIKLTISLPESLYFKYEKQAAISKVPPEREILDRLSDCAEYTSGRPLYFTDPQRVELERLTGGHLLTTSDLALKKITELCQIMVGDVLITLDKRVLDRAQSRAKSERLDVGKWIEKEVVRAMEEAVGLR